MPSSTNNKLDFKTNLIKFKKLYLTYAIMVILIVTGFTMLVRVNAISNSKENQIVSIDNFFENYEKTFENSVNSYDAALLNSYIIDESPYNNTYSKIISEYKENNKNLEFLEANIKNNIVNINDNHYFVIVEEKYNLDITKKNITLNNYIYKLIYENNTFRIVDRIQI